MVYGGVRDVLVTNEVVGRQKLRRLVSLAQTARVGMCADDGSQVRALEAAASDAGITLPVYVEVNMGGNRCGVEPGEPALQLATLIAAPRFCRIAGLSRLGQHLRGWGERRQAIAQAVDRAGRTRDLLAVTASNARLSPGRHRQLRVRDGERRLHRAAMRLLHLHGRRLRA